MANEVEGAARASENTSGRARSPILIALLVAVGFLVLRLPSMVQRHGMDDEGLYSIVASEWMDGGRLYVEALERKPPLLFASYATVFSLFGRYNMVAIHITAALWTLLTMLGLFVAGRRLFGARGGLAAAILYGIYCGWGDFVNLAWNGEILLNLPLAWAIVLVLRKTASRWRAELLAAGALLGCAFLLKQPGAAAAPALGIYLLLPSYRQSRGLKIQHSLLHAAQLTVGFAVILGATIAYFHAQGTLKDALYWVIQHHDMPHGPSDPIFWERFAVSAVWFSLACLPLVMAAIFSLGRENKTLDWAELRAERTAVLLLLVGALMGVSASGRFYRHYYLLLVPALSLAAAPVAAALFGRQGREGPWPLRRRTFWWVVAASAAIFFTVQARGLAKRNVVSEAADYIREHSTASDRIFVWGEACHIYFESRRRPSSRFIGTYPLTGYPYGGALSYEPTYVDTSDRIVPGAWDILERELAEKPPRFIVDAEATLTVPRYPYARFPLLARLIDSHYRKVLRAKDGVIYERI